MITLRGAGLETDPAELSSVPGTAPGTYAVLLQVPRERNVRIGKLSELTVHQGHYIYVGSAFGPGGVHARVRRHCRTGKCLRWHVDYLRESSLLVEVWYTHDVERREHDWAETLVAMGLVPCIEGFGSSDCRCFSHLFRGDTRPGARSFRKLVSSRLPGHGPVGVWSLKANARGSIPSPSPSVCASAS